MTTKAAPLVVIISGGTGGHVFPGIAVARCLKAKGIAVLWLGTSNRLDSKLVPREGIDFIPTDVKALRGKGILNWLVAPWLLSLAFWKVLAQFIKRRPALVLGMGGFVTGPGGVAAFILGIPLIIHEQNAIAGLTNKCLAPLSQRILSGFPEIFKSKQATWVGNPVRDEIKELATNSESEHYERLHERLREKPQERLHLLVLGGSLGASFLNEIVPQAIALIAEEERPQVKHQTGKGHLAKTVQQIQKFKSYYQAFEFEEQVHKLYRWADLILCRAGAMTIAEVSAAGRVAIFVPYPYAVDDHQSANARYLVSQNAALMVRQDKLTAPKLADLLGGFIRDRNALAKMAAATRRAAILDADSKITDICLAEMAT